MLDPGELGSSGSPGSFGMIGGLMSMLTSGVLDFSFGIPQKITIDH